MKYVKNAICEDFCEPSEPWLVYGNARLEARMWHGRHNYSLNRATVLRDLYRFVSMVAADRDLMRSATGRDDPLLALRAQFLQDEFVHLLVGTAVPNRIQLEHMRDLRADPSELDFRTPEHVCGILRPDMLREREVPLTFREACNKIVHAMHIVVETAGDPDFYFSSNVVVLRGEWRDEAWIAHLRILDYVRASVRNFEDC